MLNGAFLNSKSISYFFVPYTLTVFFSEVKYQETIELSKVFLHLLEEGFIVLQFKDKIILELEDAQEIDQIIYHQFVFGKPFVALVDGRDVESSITHEARDFFSKDELVMDIRKAHAIVVNSLPTRLLANFYMKFHKPINPIKVFSDYAIAYQWIKPIRDQWYL